MYWRNFADFLAMGGHGLSVWGSYAITAAVLIGECVLLAQRRRRSLEEARRWRLAHASDSGTGDAGDRP